MLRGKLRQPWMERLPLLVDGMFSHLVVVRQRFGKRGRHGEPVDQGRQLPPRVATPEEVQQIHTELAVQVCFDSLAVPVD